ncbi:MAG: amidohydrolase family protein, partial [Rhodopirellula sp.]|nr:amidohydrolase family protein [Rhodopirellula sp.]
QEHPWKQLLDAGASVCIGTDGRSSNPDYSLWSELLFLTRQSDAEKWPRILAAGTRSGAKAFGLENSAGTLTPGKRADLTLISLPESTGADPWTSLFAPHAKPVVTIVNGLATGAAASAAEPCNADRELRTMLLDRLA